MSGHFNGSEGEQKKKLAPLPSFFIFLMKEEEIENEEWTQW